MSNLFNNFISGFAFGMMANNPFFGGCFGFGFGMYPMFGRVDFGGFANPFPSIFGNMGYSSMTAQIPPSTFANASFPAVDFSGVYQTIWDTYADPDSNYNKQMREAYKQMEEQAKNKSDSSGQKQSVSQFGFPFSSFYMPSVFTNPWMTGYMGQTTVRSDNTLTENKKNEKKSSNNSKMEFEAAYEKLGITDKRFQKMFEECILINEGRKPNEDIIIEKDVHSKNKNGVLQGSYDSYRDRKGLPHRDVAEMTAEEMCEIYYQDFYIKGGAAEIKDDRLALYVFDSDVNMGTGTGMKILKKSGNDAEKFQDERRKEYSKRKNFSTYKNAWYNRINRTGKYADSNFSVLA